MGKNIRLDSEKVFGTMESMEKMIAKGRDDMTKAKLVVSNDKDMPTSGKEFLGGAGLCLRQPGGRGGVYGLHCGGFV
jgi:hypothetical protein